MATTSNLSPTEIIDMLANKIAKKIPVEACTLRKVPPEIRTLIFVGVGDGGIDGALDLKNLAVAFSGDNDLRNEVIDIMCKAVPFVVSTGHISNNWIEKNVLQSVINRVQALELRIKGTYYHYGNREMLSTKNIPKALESANAVRHIHLESRGVWLFYFQLADVLNIWVPRLGSIRKLSATFDKSRSGMISFRRLDAGLGLKATVVQGSDGSETLTWEAAEGSTLVLDNQASAKLLDIARL